LMRAEALGTSGATAGEVFIADSMSVGRMIRQPSRPET
jgi:hypothetical protein